MQQGRRLGLSNTVPKMFFLWNAVVLGGAQVLNLALGLSWLYLIGVYGILVNGFVIFLRLLLGDDDAA